MLLNNKYRRTFFMKDEVVDGILEKDIVNNNWDLWEIKRPMSFFTVSRSYIQRPDLISLKLYGKVNYWWILAKVNPEIMDWWNDITINQIINVPDIFDIEDFYANVKKRQNSF